MKAHVMNRLSSGRSGPAPPYDLNRMDNQLQTAATNESLDYTHSNVDVESSSESYVDIGMARKDAVAFDSGTSSVHGLASNSYGNFHDATNTVREMHLALLYLLSNPEEFQKALQTHPPNGTTTLREWNAEYETESMTEAGSMVSTAIPNTSMNNATNDDMTSSNATPLPFIVFADDAEVVLPQAYSASQLFGLERLEGIELEAAAGIVSLSQLFLRWLALMPGGDHLNIIDPPGLTVMRIAGGRYRVTAAHRVVWTWMNEFAALSDSGNINSIDEVQTLQIGDLVTMTIVDVFETDNHGKLLSYCPTFDNRAVHKTNPATETLRKSSTKILSIIGRAQKSSAAKSLMTNVKSVAGAVKQRVDGYYGSPRKSQNDEYRPPSDASANVTDAEGFQKAMQAAEDAAVGQSNKKEITTDTSKDENEIPRGEGYISDDDDEAQKQMHI